MDRSVAQGPDRPVDRLARAVPLTVGVIGFLAARAALQPGVAFWDTAELQAVAPLMGTAHPTGFPTYVLLGWLASVVFAPLGEPAFRMNLLAAVCLGVAAGVTTDLVRSLTRSTAMGVLAGIGTALTPMVWRVSTHAEAHALHLALLAILLRLLVAWEDRRANESATADRWLVGATVVFALAVGNHSLTLLLAIPVGLYVLAVDPRIFRRPRLVAACLVALAATLTVVYLELPLRAGPFRAPLVYGHPETLEGFLYVVLAEQFRGSLEDPFGDLLGKTLALARLAVDQLGPLAALLPAAFLVTALRRPRYALLTGSAALITCFFAASYVNADIDRYYAGPLLIAWTWLAFLGRALADALADLFDPRRRRSWMTLLAGALVVALALAPTALALPRRFAAVDERRNVAAADWLDHVLSVMEEDALIVSWWSYSTPLWYAQLVEGRRPDLAIVDDRTRLDENLGDFTDVIDANLGKRPVYVIRNDPREVALLADRYELEYIDGVDAFKLTRVLGLKASAS